MKLIIRTLKGLEAVLADELGQLGCSKIEILTRAVACEASLKQMYQCNYLLRTAIKVMVAIAPEVVVNDDYELYNEVKRIPWENYFKVNQSFSVEGVTHSEIFRHSQYVGLKSKDAIADRFRDGLGKRPFVNPVSPDFPVVIHIRHNILTILIDSSGPSLHLRGYRVYPVDAPLNEVLAAGLVLLSGWDKKQIFLDPMCGSGTLLIEAALYAANHPPQTQHRKYAFMNWKDFDSGLWKEVVIESNAKINFDNMPAIIGYDKALRCVNASQTNLNEVKLEHYIKVERKDFFTDSGKENVFIIMNPPYDERLKEDDIIKFYQNIGDKLKKEYLNTTAWIIGGHIEALKMLGLKPSKKIPMLNGDIEVGFHKFEIYEGSKKNSN